MCRAVIRVRLASLLFCCLAVPAHAGLILTIQKVVATPGSTGHLQVTLTNDSPSASVDVSGFNFLINSLSPDISLDSADFATTSPYIFAGNSFDQDNGLSLNISSGPSLSASDSADNPPAFTVVGPGATFGIADVLYTVSPTAAYAFDAIQFDMDPANTSVSDQNGAAIPIDGFVNGGVLVSPEPGSVWLIFSGLPFLTMLRRRRF